MDEGQAKTDAKRAAEAEWRDSIAFGNSDKKPVTWSNIKFVKRG